VNRSSAREARGNGIISAPLRLAWLDDGVWRDATEHRTGIPTFPDLSALVYRAGI